MTLYDELVKLFREHRWGIDEYGYECSCGQWVCEHDVDFERAKSLWAEHLAALACERVEQVIESLQPGDDWIDAPMPTPHRTVTPEKLAKAWRIYAAFFGEPPHGTEKQLAALLELIPRRVKREE